MHIVLLWCTSILKTLDKGNSMHKNKKLYTKCNLLAQSRQNGLWIRRTVTTEPNVAGNASRDPSKFWWTRSCQSRGVLQRKFGNVNCFKCAGMVCLFN